MSLHRRRRRGANAVEFALIAPALILILAGVMEYGWFFMNQILLDSAAREGARAGARTPEDAIPSPGTVAETEAADHWDSLGIPGAPTFKSEVVTSSGEDLIVLTATLPYDGLIGFYTPVPDTVRARVAVRSESND